MRDCVNGCGRTTDLFGCRVCADILADQLGDVPALTGELEITTVRLHRLGGKEQRGGETPLAFHAEASDTQWALANTLGTWASLIAEERGLILDLARQRAVPPSRWSGRAVIPKRPPNDVASLAARWLLKHLQSLRSSESFGELCDEVVNAIRGARRVIDRRGDRRYAGPCDGLGAIEVDGEAPCGTGLYAEPEGQWVSCWTCGREYDVALRRQWMLDDLREYLGSSQQVARICTSLGVKVAESTVRMWVKRGKLQPRDWVPSMKDDGKPKPLYRVADILVVATGQIVDFEADGNVVA